MPQQKEFLVIAHPRRPARGHDPVAWRMTCFAVDKCAAITHARHCVADHVSGRGFRYTATPTGQQEQ